MQFFQKHGGYVFLVFTIVFIAWLLLFRPAFNWMTVTDQSRGSMVKVSSLFVSSGSYVVVTRLDRYGRLIEDTATFSEYLLPGNYHNVYVKLDESTAPDSIEPEQGVIIEIYKETHKSSSNELFYGEEDVIAKDILGRPLRKKILFK